jgi:hypothetical protein
MKHSSLFKLLTLLLLGLFAFAACTPADTDDGGDTPADTATEATTDDVMEEFVGTTLAAPDCEYGGKISSIEAVDKLTVKFTLCKSDPAFQAKIAFTPFGVQPAEHIAATGGTGDLLSQPIGTGPLEIGQLGTRRQPHVQTLRWVLGRKTDL